MKWFVWIALFGSLALVSCEDCKECFLVEENTDLSTETPVGQRCDRQIEELESHDLVCLSDECYYECR